MMNLIVLTVEAAVDFRVGGCGCGILVGSSQAMG